MILLVRDVDALEAVDVPGEAALADMCLTGLNSLGQRVVDEHVLLLGLDQMVPLVPDVLEEGEDVEVAPGLDLAHHGVEDHVAAGPAHAGAEKRKKRRK